MARMAGDVVPFERSNDRYDESLTLPPEALPDDAVLPLVGDDTKARILRVAMERFASRGYHATSIREIASLAGVQSASLYSHFPSKEAILAELVRLGHEVHHRTLVEALAASGADPRDQLRHLLAAHVALYCRYWKLAAINAFERQHLSPEVDAQASALLGATWFLVQTVLDRGVEQGFFTIANRDMTQVALASLGSSVIHWYPKQPHGVTPEEVGEYYAGLGLRMVGVQD